MVCTLVLSCAHLEFESMFIWFTIEQLQCVIPVTAKSLSEQCEVESKVLCYKKMKKISVRMSQAFNTIIMITH